MLYTEHRIPTGYKARTIQNPLFLSGYNDLKTQVADVMLYDWKKQKANFDSLANILKEYGHPLETVASARYKGDRGENHRFVAADATGKVLWYKYVGYVAQGGQNHLWLHGFRIKVSSFLRLNPAKQNALVQGDPAHIALVFTEKELKILNDSTVLWN